MGMNHEELFPELSPQRKVRQSMLWVGCYAGEYPMAHWLFHYLENILKNSEFPEHDDGLKTVGEMSDWRSNDL